MFKRGIFTLFLIVISIILSSCNTYGENVLVYIEQTEKLEWIKVNAITDFGKDDKQIILKAIMDVYDKDNNYLRTTILHINGSVENTKTTSHKDGPTTLMTENLYEELTIQLTGKEKNLVKAHILSNMKILQEGKNESKEN